MTTHRNSKVTAKKFIVFERNLNVVITAGLKLFFSFQKALKIFIAVVIKMLVQILNHGKK